MLRRSRDLWGKICFPPHATSFDPFSWTLNHLSLASCSVRSSSSSTKMTNWQIHQYGGVEELMLKSSRQPTIRSPNEILVKVHASSVNPIDVKMMGGYGRNMLNSLRKQRGIIKSGTEFPLVLGRDFSGTIVEIGQGTSNFNIGDEVWGAIGAHRPGTHAEYAIVSQSEISHKPSNLSHTEAASIPYVAMTTWVALCTIGRLKPENTYGKRVLILGGSGGIGTFAIQMLTAWGADVTVTCSADAVESLKSLGAEVALDYTCRDVWSDLKLLEKFDLILDGVGDDSIEKAVSLLNPRKNSSLITLKSPILANADTFGMVPGMMKTVLEAGIETIKGALSGKNIRWAVFMPNGKAMNRIKQMVEKDQIQPVIQQVLPFSQVDVAYQTVLDGHLRGKVVIDNLDKS